MNDWERSEHLLKVTDEHTRALLFNHESRLDSLEADKKLQRIAVSAAFGILPLVTSILLYLRSQ